MAYDQFNGPIPGENYTTDTKNFPWHRPPEYTDLDEAIQACMTKLMDDENAPSYIYLIEAGMDITILTQIFLMSGVSAGKWTLDFALLLAGPVSHILVLMCKGYDVEYELGIEPTKPVVTSVFMKRMAKLEEEAEELAEETLEGEVTPTDTGMEGEEPSEPSGGFMSAPPEEAGEEEEQPQGLMGVGG